MFGAPNPNAAQAQKLKDNSQQIITPFDVQLAFVNIKEKSKPFKPGDEGSYGVTGLVPKANTEAVGWFAQLLCQYAGVQDLSQIPIHPFVNGSRPELWNDGDDLSKAEYTGFAGHWFFKATTGFESIKENLFTDVEMDGTPCQRRQATPEEIYSGCFAKLIICCAEYMRPGQVKFYLSGILKTAKGEMWQGGNMTRELLGMADKTALLQGAPAPQSQPMLQPAPPVAPPTQYAPPVAPQPAPQQYAPPVGPQPAPSAPQGFAPQGAVMTAPTAPTGFAPQGVAQGTVNGATTAVGAPAAPRKGSQLASVLRQAN